MRLLTPPPPFPREQDLKEGSRDFFTGFRSPNQNRRTKKKLSTVFAKNGQNREKQVLRSPFAQEASKMANTHESNLNLTFRIEWRCPFIARIHRSRDIGSRHEIGRISERVKSIMFFENHFLTV